MTIRLLNALGCGKLANTLTANYYKRGIRYFIASNKDSIMATAVLIEYEL